MSYTPTNWDNGDIITAEKLNKIEQGISDVSNNSGSSEDLDSNVLLVPLTVDTTDPENPVFTATKTAGEMLEADMIVFTYEITSAPFGNGTIKEPMTACVLATNGSSSFKFNDSIFLTANSSNDYPTNASSSSFNTAT